MVAMVTHIKAQNVAISKIHNRPEKFKLKYI